MVVALRRPRSRSKSLRSTQRRCCLPATPCSGLISQNSCQTSTAAFLSLIGSVSPVAEPSAPCGPSRSGQRQQGGNKSARSVALLIPCRASMRLPCSVFLVFLLGIPSLRLLFFWSPRPVFHAFCLSRLRFRSTCSFVPESILKKRKAREELKKKAVAARKTEKVAAKKRREGMFKRAEQYVKEYAAAEKATIEAKRAARVKGDFYGEFAVQLFEALVFRCALFNCGPCSSLLMQSLPRTSSRSSSASAVSTASAPRSRRSSSSSD